MVYNRQNTHFYYTVTQMIFCLGDRCVTSPSLQYYCFDMSSSILGKSALPKGQVGEVLCLNACSQHGVTPSPSLLHLQVIPEGGSLTSGVYTLLSEGSLPARHVDHPHTRRRGSRFEGTGQPDVAALSQPLTSAGLHLQSQSMAFCGR